ncbi:hypothetical protein F4814DRAFT_452402 [Daldinia grandis]|nr:hypothetical protein F4814DRAFT_452402 [Daldinia grandis]
MCVSSAAEGPVAGQTFNALYATILGPFFLTILLMFALGLLLFEVPAAKKRFIDGFLRP